MGEVVYLRQNTLRDLHTKMDCPGFFQLYRKDDIKYQLSLNLPLLLDNTPFVLCEECETAYFPKGFEVWLETTMVLTFFDMGVSLPGSIYKMARLLTGLTAEDIAQEPGLEKIQYQSFEQNKVNLDNRDELKVKLCLSRLLDFDMHKFRGITKCDDFLVLNEIKRVDVSGFQVQSWF